MRWASSYGNFIAALDFWPQCRYWKNRNTNVHKCADGHYKYDNVFTEDIVAKLSNLVNCSVPYINRTGSGVAICTDEDSYHLAYEEYKRLTTNQPLQVQYPRTVASPPCGFMMSQFTPMLERKSYGNRSFVGLIYIKFPATITIQEQMRSYNGLSYLAEVGGYVGLFLGYSILQLSGYMGQTFQFLFQKLIFRFHVPSNNIA